ncbi:peptidylprolyl isomerase [Bisgaard Taxon 10/6]|uniref:Periplasmic chaperone PpiD n=1 Tax=Exercitatus varius TaxID=67857 RepID=A0ABT6ES75_9PAST|nr:peptidylprolyl isomerase [Exercitatus varius]MDG2939921.1 peptidylprolyl isomerase [Exercitatus varius]MDG2945408.1 peptidylprolyl isomerase [Exercitatus varius]
MLMEKLHHAANSWVSKAILGAIAVSFVISGMYGYLGSSSDTSAVKVNGEEISQQNFQQQYNNEFQRLEQQLGPQFAALSDTPEFTAGLRQTVLNRLIDQELLRQYGDELNIAVSDEQIKREIVRTPEFQVDGKFSNETYQLFLRNNNLSSDAYAQYLREALRLAQLQTALTDTAFLVPASQDTFAKGFFQSRTVRLAHLPLAAEIAKQTVTEEEIRNYYDSNKSAFTVPELIKVQYLDLTPAIAEKAVKVTDVEIQRYYQDHKADFTTKGQERLAHIQLANEKEALDAYEALQKGADFATVAKEKSNDKVSAANGGDLGWLNAGDLPKEFEDAATILEVGRYSTPVNVDGQFHIIRVLDRKDSALLPLEQVREQITQAIRRDLVSNQFYSLEKQVAEKAFEDRTSLTSAAKTAGVEVKETDYFPRNGVPAELNFPSVVNAMFDGDVSQGNVNSEPMNVGEQHSVVVRVVDHKAEGTRSLEDTRQEITDFLKRQKAETAVLAQAENIVKELEADKPLPAGISFGAEEKWVYAENKAPALNNIIFTMQPKENRTAYKAAKANNGDVMIVALDKVEDGQVDDTLRQRFDAQVLQDKMRDAQIHLLQSLRAKAKIEVNESFMKQNEDN